MPFSGSGSSRHKILLHAGCVDALPELLTVLRSLNCVHIALGPAAQAPDLGVPRNILPQPGPGKQPADVVRRWFMQRKPETGFLLTGFPSTLTEAQQLDEWLDARGETLDVTLFPHDAAISSIAVLKRYYAAQALLWTPSAQALVPAWLCPVPAQ